MSAHLTTLCDIVYQVFLKGPSLYAFRGLAGRFAPIGVHLALLLIMGGGTLSATGSFRGSVTVPQGLNFIIGDALEPAGFLSTPSESFNTEVHVNRFYMDYYDSGEVSSDNLAIRVKFLYSFLDDSGTTFCVIISGVAISQ